MKIAVTDTNIFIYLIKANLLRGLFEIGYEIHTTNFVINELGEEITALLGPWVSINKLIVYSFSEDETEAIDKMELPKGLSFQDKGLYFYLNFWEGSVLLTNDGLLRKTIVKKDLEVHGVLWVLDHYNDKKLYTSQELSDGSKKMLAGYNRLPKTECEVRLKKWDKC